MGTAVGNFSSVRHSKLGFPYHKVYWSKSGQTTGRQVEGRGVLFEENNYGAALLKF